MLRVVSGAPRRGVEEEVPTPERENQERRARIQRDGYFTGRAALAAFLERFSVTTCKIMKKTNPAMETQPRMSPREV